MESTWNGTRPRKRRGPRSAAGLSLLLVLQPQFAQPLPDVRTPPAAAFPAQRTALPRAAVPFGPGEEMRYTVGARWAVLRGGGDASLAVEALDTIRGHLAYRLAFRIDGGLAFLGIDDLQRSWLDTDRLHSLRFEQKLDQTFYERDRTLDFFPEAMRWEQLGNPEVHGKLASRLPLDDVSFLYFVRSIPLVVGETRTFHRYFKENGNPVVVRVLRKERVTVPYGEFDAVVVQPIIRTGGLFREDGKALLWFSDDDRKLLLKLEATARGSVGLRIELAEYTPGTRLAAVGGEP